MTTFLSKQSGCLVQAKAGSLLNVGEGRKVPRGLEDKVNSQRVQNSHKMLMESWQITAG